MGKFKELDIERQERIVQVRKNRACNLEYLIDYVQHFDSKELKHCTNEELQLLCDNWQKINPSLNVTDAIKVIRGGR